MRPKELEVWPRKSLAPAEQEVRSRSRLGRLLLLVLHHLLDHCPQLLDLLLLLADRIHGAAIFHLGFSFWFDGVRLLLRILLDLAPHGLRLALKSGNDLAMSCLRQLGDHGTGVLIHELVELGIVLSSVDLLIVRHLLVDRH